LNKKRVVWIFTSSRSEGGFMQPIIDRAKNIYNLDAYKYSFDPTNSFSEICKHIQEDIDKTRPNIVLIPCDRREMVPVAMTCFYNNIPTIHFYAGTYSYSGTHDDVGRHAISLFSHIMCCESQAAKDILIKAGEEPWRIVVTGGSHFDDIEIDTSLCPAGQKYDLLLLLPEQFGDNSNQIMWEKARKMVRPNIFTIAIKPNEDPGADKLWKNIKQGLYNYPVIWHDKSVPRMKFLGLLKNCEHYISNSSSTLFEAPAFNIKVLNPSQRNRIRTPPDPSMLRGGADKVVKLLSELDLSNPELLTKKVREYPPQ